MRLRFLTFFSDWLNSKEWLFPRSNGTFEVLLIVRGTELCYHQCDYAISRISKLLNSTRFPELIFESFLCLFIFFFIHITMGNIIQLASWVLLKLLSESRWLLLSDVDSNVTQFLYSEEEARVIVG